jgi:hypothetical protein
MDVKKIGRIPDGGGWRAHGREMGSTSRRRNTRIGYDYIHSVVDDHSRYAYSEILSDETAATTAAFFARALTRFAEHGIHIDAVMTDNAWNYTHSNALRSLLDASGAKHILIRRTAHGRTARSNASTRPCNPNGPTDTSSRPTPPARPRLPRGSTTTTLAAATAPSEDSRPPAGCHQPDGQVQLAGRGTARVRFLEG